MPFISLSKRLGYLFIMLCGGENESTKCTRVASEEGMDDLAMAHYGKPFAELDGEQQQVILLEMKMKW